ncbi:putative serine carboxypeptidase CPVL [Rhipicephalus microplus]|uniref:putative serine carboxypeptidase CPVL n=1 Tax=Rhipicephalus microplus TaxID=6941 RepID=UPI003F6C8E72
MNHMIAWLVFLVFFVSVRTVKTDDQPKLQQGHCADNSENSGDLIFTVPDIKNKTRLAEKKNKSRVCLPVPCADVEAYSGFIKVDKNSNSSLFFLHVKSQGDADKKPLLLWLQGGPGKSSLFGQFLENGPLGIHANGKLFYRNHTIAEYMNLIYLDQPSGSGYSFNNGINYTTTLDDASTHIIRFLRRFLRIFPEYVRTDFYIAGESYGARFTVALASEILKNITLVPLKLRGVMLGVGFLFPVLDLIDSSDYLFSSGLLDHNGRKTFADRFQMIKELKHQQNYTAAAVLLSRTVMNLDTAKNETLFQRLTGFKHQSSIARTEKNEEVAAYYKYANSDDFKKIIHVDSSRVLDGTRYSVVMALALNDLFKDHRNLVEYVFNRTRVLFYTGQFDAVFPEMNMERCFRELKWRGAAMFHKAERAFWHRENNSSLELFGYERIAGALTYANVLFGGHHISMDRSIAVSDLYRHFLTSHDLLTTTTEMIAC